MLYRTVSSYVIKRSHAQLRTAHSDMAAVSDYKLMATILLTGICGHLEATVLKRKVKKGAKFETNHIRQ